MRSAQSTLSVAVNPDGDAVHIRLEGELDVTSSPLLQTVVDQVLARREPLCRLLVVDMSGVSFADASGMTPILLARALLVRRGGRVELRHGRRGLLRLLRALDLDDMHEAG